MKQSCRVLSVVLLIAALSSASGQVTTKPETFASFWTKFKVVMARNDKQAVADLTKLPFLYDSEERDRAGFLKIYSELFTRKVRRCVATAKPIRTGTDYEIFCGELIFLFGKDTDGKFKLLEFGVND